MTPIDIVFAVVVAALLVQRQMEQRAHARELAAERHHTTSLLDRIRTAPQLEVHPKEPERPALSDRKPYVTDHPYDDELWEKLRTGEDQDSD